MDVFLPARAELARPGRPARRRRRNGAAAAAPDRPVLNPLRSRAGRSTRAALQARRLPPAVADDGRQPVLRVCVRRVRDARGLRHGGGPHRDRDGPRHAGRLPRAPDATRRRRSASSSTRSPTSCRSAWRRRSSRSQWGLWPLGRLGWAAGFIYLTAVAMRLARFNIQTATVTDKRYFAGLPSPAAAGVIASTVFLYPWGLQDARAAVPGARRWCSCPRC